MMMMMMKMKTMTMMMIYLIENYIIIMHKII